MSLADEVKAKEEVWDSRKDIDRLMAEATHALAARTRSLAVAALEDGRVWHSGYSNIFINPEFADLEVCSDLFSLIEEGGRLRELFFVKASSGLPIDVLFGEELDWPEYSSLGVIATHFNIYGKNAALGVIGPARLSYPTIIPVLRYFRSLIEEVSK